MPSRSYEFVQLDVFTQTALTGNPLAIFIDARGLSDDEMQALAREMNLSETTFILPRDATTEGRDGKKVRIFTVAEELPFAGHPTLGTALYLYAAESISNSTKPAEITLDLKAGKIPVRFTEQTENAEHDRVDGRIFGEMRQRDPEFGTTFSRAEIARLIGVATDEIAEDWPVQSVSTGLTFTIVPLCNPETLANLSFTYALAEEFLKERGGKFFYFLCPERRPGGAGSAGSHVFLRRRRSSHGIGRRLCRELDGSTQDREEQRASGDPARRRNSPTERNVCAGDARRRTRYQRSGGRIRCRSAARNSEALGKVNLIGDQLLTIGVHGSGHAAENLPRAVSTNPRVRDPQRVGSHFGCFVRGPVRLDPIMVDRDVAGHANGELLDRVGLQLQSLGRVRRNPIGDVIFSRRRRTNIWPTEEVLVPERAILLQIVGFHVFPVRFLQIPDLCFVPG